MCNTNLIGLNKNNLKRNEYFVGLIVNRKVKKNQWQLSKAPGDINP